MSYRPGETTGKLYRPVSLVTTVCELFVAVSIRVTSAPDTAAPVGALTRPERLPEDAGCAEACVVQRMSRKARQTRAGAKKNHTRALMRLKVLIIRFSS